MRPATHPSPIQQTTQDDEPKAAVVCASCLSQVMNAVHIIIEMMVFQNFNKKIELFKNYVYIFVNNFGHVTSVRTNVSSVVYREKAILQLKTKHHE